MLCDVEGLSYEEIAQILDAKLGTVRSRIHRGRAMLRAALAHRAPAEGRTRYQGPRPLPGVRTSRRDRVVIGHLGPRVSALLDGQLSPADEERAWEHVHSCHQCRDAVEREGWVKTRLATMQYAGSAAPSHLKGSLLVRGIVADWPALADDRRRWLTRRRPPSPRHDRHQQRRRRRRRDGRARPGCLARPTRPAPIVPPDRRVVRHRS